MTKKRMETIDDEIAARAAEFIEKQAKAGTNPMFVWVNFTHMHFRTHVKPESLGQAGRWQSPYHDGMIDHDKNVGTVPDKIDQPGIADNTIVMYSTFPISIGRRRCWRQRENPTSKMMQTMQAPANEND